MRRFGAAVTVIAALSLAACGSTASTTTGDASTTTSRSTATASGTTTSAATTTAAAAAKTGLARFLLVAGDEPGFPPAPGGGTFFTLKGWVDFTLLTAADERVLRSEGFVAAAQENLGGANRDGANFVEEFSAAQGARREAIHDAHESSKGGSAAASFTVPGLPNSHGVLVAEGGGIGSNIYWTEGRCTLWIGNQGAVPLKPQVVAGAEAIYRRTEGRCP